MDRNFLKESASQLKPISKASAFEYSQKEEQLIAKMNICMLERKDIEQLIGKNNIEMMKDNHSNHVRFMVSVFQNFNSDVLIETILWVFRAYRSHHFTTNYWATQLNTWINLLKTELSPDCYQEIIPYYYWMQLNIPIFVKLSDEKLDSTQSLH